MSRRRVSSGVVAGGVWLALAVAGCAPGAGGRDDDDEQEDEEEEAEEAADVGPCADVGAGLVVEGSGEFVAGDDPDGVVVVMGGAAEVDRASARFVDGAGGGDVLVLRASGSTSSYTAYFDLSSGELGGVTLPPRAVATVRVDDPAVIVGDDADDADGADGAAVLDAGLACRLRRADAVWLAGGDQSDYLLSWPPALHDALAAAVARGVAVGGTSAGAMALSEFAYDARDGGIDSADALADPAATSVSPSPFFAPALAGGVVDTHFFARDREGRLLAFLARAQGLGGDRARFALGLDEEAAAVFDGDGFTVLAEGDAAVWRYTTEGQVTATPGQPLSIERVVRTRLGDGDGSGDDLTPALLSVVEGVVVDGAD